ncbi:MAG: Holliday junction resolvase RuvX [Planctomycetota bacterium]
MTLGRRDRVLAVDFGDRRTGLAGTDPTGTIISPLEPLVGLDQGECANAVAQLARERRSEVVVVGLPLAAQGEVGHRAQRTLGFVEVLRSVSPCPVETFDERNTTDEAHARLKRGGLKAAQRRRLADSVAALVILERFREADARGRQ